jgi:RimJ/RimL family protein N-acetyltransferase
VRRVVRRFVAETERDNVGSGRFLERMGFRKSGTDYSKEPSEREHVLLSAFLGIV